MTDVRQRLADALQRELDEHGYEDDDEKRGQVAYHFADVLLSLPGIAIVDTEAVDQVAKAIFANRRHHEPVKAWEFLYSDEQDSYRAMAQASLLAAANAAEQVTQGDNA